MVKSNQTNVGSIPSLSLISCVMVGKLLNFSEPRFFFCIMEYVHSTYRLFRLSCIFFFCQLTYHFPPYFQNRLCFMYFEAMLLGAYVIAITSWMSFIIESPTLSLSMFFNLDSILSDFKIVKYVFYPFIFDIYLGSGMSFVSCV